MKKIILSLIAISVLAMPVLAMAQIGGNPPYGVSTNLTDLGKRIVAQVWIIFTVIAVIAFVIAGILFLTAAGSPEKIAQARQAFLWGIAGIVVGIIAFSIVAIIRGSLF